MARTIAIILVAAIMVPAVLAQQAQRELDGSDVIYTGTAASGTATAGGQAAVAAAPGQGASSAASENPGPVAKALKWLGDATKTVVGGAMIMFLDAPVWTTTKDLSDETRDKILKDIQPGDVILETNNVYPNWQRMEKIAYDSVYTHAAMFEGWDSKGNPIFLEATTGTPIGDAVVETNLKEYLRGKIAVSVVRPAYRSTADRDKAVEYCKKQLGKPYDSSFSSPATNGDKSHYCAGLVWKGLKAAGIDLPLVKAKVKGDSASPDMFLSMPGKTMVHDGGATFWKNQASHWPAWATIAATTVGGIVAGASLGGPVGACIGGVGGLVAGLGISIGVGKLQADQAEPVADTKSSD